jgi:hypothetical protein
LNTGRRATDGLNRFVRRTRRSKPTGPKLVGPAGREIRRKVAPVDRYSIPGNGREDSESNRVKETARVDHQIWQGFLRQRYSKGSNVGEIQGSSKVAD